MIFFLIFLLLGFYRMKIYTKNFPTNIPFGSNVELVGRVIDEPDRRSDRLNIVLESEYGKTSLKFSPFEEIFFGDLLCVSGKIEEPYNKNYSARYNIFSEIKRPVLMDCNSHRDGAYFFTKSPEEKSLSENIFVGIFSLKNILQNRINHIYFEPEAAFVSGLLLGSRNGMSKEISENFKVVGLTHIVAISGYNISLVVLAIFAIFSFLPLKRRIIVSSVAILFFVFLVGASAAVVRSGIMGVLALYGTFAGRKSQVLFALLWSAVVMIFLNPYILFYDVGFQLSFASTFGLITFSPLLEEVFRFRFGQNMEISRQSSLFYDHIKNSKIFKFICEAFILTLSAQIATLPIIAFHFGRVSLISPFANLLAAPFVPFAMLFSFLSLLSDLFAYPAIFFLDAILLVAEIFAKIPFASLNLQIGLGILFFSYAGLIFILLKFYKQALARAFRPWESF